MDLATDPAVEKAREAALRLLDRSRKTRRELERKLTERDHDPAAIAAALDRLAGVGLIDDVEYAQAFARSRFARRAVALRIVRQELKRRGVGDDDLERAFAGLDDGGAAERARAERALAPIWRRHHALDPRERRARCAAALARRGFDYDAIHEALEAVLHGGSPEAPTRG